MIDLVSDIGFALGDRALHRVERSRQTAELIRARGLDGHFVATLLDTMSRRDELSDRTGGAAAQKRADQDRQHQRDSVDHQQSVAYVAVGSEDRVARLLQNDVNRIATRIEALRVGKKILATDSKNNRRVVRFEHRGGEHRGSCALRLREC